MFFLFWVTFLGGLAASTLVETFQTWFLGYWARQYELRPSNEVNTNLLVIIVVFVVLALMCDLSAIWRDIRRCSLWERLLTVSGLWCSSMDAFELHVPSIKR